MTCCVSHVICPRESPPRFNRTVGRVHLLVDGLYVVEAHKRSEGRKQRLGRIVPVGRITDSGSNPVEWFKKWIAGCCVQLVSSIISYNWT